MSKYAEHVRRTFAPRNEKERLEERLASLKRTETMYREGWHYGIVTGRGSDEDWERARIDIVAVRKEIADIKAKLNPTYTLEEILAEL